MSEPTPPAQRPTHWRRAVRPLIWWSIMVLLMFAYRTHERLSAKTWIDFEPTLAGKRVMYEAGATIDGKPANSGQRIPIGWHTLTITHPKTKSFSTNLFIWYGEHELGQIALERTMGTLVVTANPLAQRLTIRGPEFSVTLTNTSGITSSVPTDRYVVEVAYKHWSRRDEATVFASQSAVQNFAPKLGALRIEASHPEAAFQLRDGNRKLMDTGNLPVTVNELPEGNYQLVSMRKGDEREMTVTIRSGATNDAKVEFVYGAALVESEPSGATVYIGRRELGATPLALPELKPGEFEFSLRLNDYEPVATSLVIAANQTNEFRTNLVSTFYVRAMERASRLYDAKSFALAADAAAEALRYKGDDAGAKRLQGDAIGHGHLARAEMLGRQGDFVAAITAANSAIESLPESVYAKTLLADLTQREQGRIEAEKKRQAELEEQARKRKETELARQRRQQNLNRLTAKFNDLNRGYNNPALFAQHELAVTNAANSAATTINSALVGKQPTFEIVRYEWPQADIFTIQARQRIGVGYRECLIVGGQLQEGEMKVLFKVFEYENPPELKLLNGFLTATSSIKITSQDPQVEQKKMERFQKRVKEGEDLASNRIHEALRALIDN